MGKEVVRKHVFSRLGGQLAFALWRLTQKTREDGASCKEAFDTKGAVMKSTYEQLGGTYSRVGDYYLPNMDIKTMERSEGYPQKTQSQASVAEPAAGCVGKYGLMRKTYLKEHRPVLYAELVRSAKLHKHLSEVNEVCTRQVEEMTAQMAEREGVSEALKAADPMAWVARMNSIQNRAEEIVLREYVFA